MAKIFPIAGYITLSLIEQMIPEVFKPDYSYYLFQTGIAGVLFFVWFITQKNSAKLQKEQTENTAKQFAEIFKSMKDMQQGYLEQNNKTLDRMFSVMQEDIKYKALIAESIARFDTKLSNHINS
jgi:uncharacterized membrane protein SpoIIM required for sporulation